MIWVESVASASTPQALEVEEVVAAGNVDVVAEAGCGERAAAAAHAVSAGPSAASSWICTC